MPNFLLRWIKGLFWCCWHKRRADARQVDAASPAGSVLLIYQRDNRPILITLRRSAIICHCQGDQECANQAPRLIQPNHKPIDYFSYLSHCAARETTGGNRANGKWWAEEREGPDSKSHCLHLRWQLNAFERKYGFDPAGAQIETCLQERKLKFPLELSNSLPKFRCGNDTVWPLLRVYVCLQRWAFIHFCHLYPTLDTRLTSACLFFQFWFFF